MPALRRDWIGCDSARHLELDLELDLARSAVLTDAGSMPRYGIELASFLAVRAEGVLGLHCYDRPH